MDTHTEQRILRSLFAYQDQGLADLEAKLTMERHVANRSRDFATFVKIFAAGKGLHTQMVEQYEGGDFGFSPRVEQAIKAAVSAGSLSDPAYAANLAPYAVISNGFYESSVDLCAMQALLPYVRRVPGHSRLFSTTLAIAPPGTTGEGKGIPLSTLGVDGTTVDTQKVAVIIVVTDEVIRVSVPGTENFFEDELRRASSTATDNHFVAILEANAAAHHTSAGATATNVRADITAALTELDLGATSKVFCLVPNATFIRLGLKADGQGADAFQDFPNVGDVTFLPCAGLQVSSSGSTAIVVDADGLFVAADDVATLEVARQASIQMVDSPMQDSLAPTGSTMTSLFQTNSIALKVGRAIGCKIPRRSVTVINDVAW